MKFVPRRPVTKAVQYTEPEGKGLSDVRHFVQAVALQRVSSIAEEVPLRGPVALHIRLGSGESIVMKPTDWLCLDESARLVVMPDVDFRFTFERVDVVSSAPAASKWPRVDNQEQAELLALILAELRSWRGQVSQESAQQASLTTRIANVRCPL